MLCKLNEVDPPTSHVLNHLTSQRVALMGNLALLQAVKRGWE